ncbi:MAG: glycoside hydrolase family 88 protein [Bacteroidota bacterium]
MQKLIFLSCLFLLLTACGDPSPNATSEATEPADTPQEFPDEALDFAVEQALRLDAVVPDSLIPRSLEPDGELRLKPIRDWTSGFFASTLVYLYEYSNNPALKQAYEDRFVYLEAAKNETHTHDVGFKIQCSFGNALRITGDTATYAPVIIATANSLMTRYDEEVGAIKSWSWTNELNWNYPVIVDNMMNLELLCVASALSGDPKYREAAMSHADVTMANHFREDNSSFHVVSYNDDGTVEKKNTHQGIADESAWARGQAWGLYGYTMMHRETGEERYLEQAKKIADFLLAHPNLPEDKIPYWDFNDPDIPNVPRDASAGAIIASALVELGEITAMDKYGDAGEQILLSLASPSYLAEAGENGNFILEHSVGNMPSDDEIDVPINYADYYFIEGLMRLER